VTASRLGTAPTFLLAGGINANFQSLRIIHRREGIGRSESKWRFGLPVQRPHCESRRQAGVFRSVVKAAIGAIKSKRPQRTLCDFPYLGRIFPPPCISRGGSVAQTVYWCGGLSTRFGRAAHGFIERFAKDEAYVPAAREILAKHIIMAAQRGERNPRRLTEDALFRFGAAAIE
jgi:hypothetical protein